MPAEGDLRLWWTPQIPGKPFHVPVDSPEEAAKIYAVLGAYDQFQYENRIKPDYCNAGGLTVFEDGEWCDWSSELGDDIKHWAADDGGPELHTWIAELAYASRGTPS